MLHLPEYLPPLLLLIKQRMSNISSRSTMALTTPMNQPCVAMLDCISVTPSEGKTERGGRRERERVLVRQRQEVGDRMKAKGGKDERKSAILLGSQRIWLNTANTH